MKVPLLDLKSQYKTIKDEMDSVVNSIIHSQSFVLGKEVALLEESIARYCRSKYGIGVASGTDALFLSLKALGVKEGDEVITTPFTFVATAEAISYLNAKPVFVDLDKATYNIDPTLIEEKITARTKAIIPVHLYGQCADMDPILKIAERHGLKVVEDSAQAIGATYRGKHAGSMAHAGALSFFPSKNLGAFGDAGMIVTDDKDAAEHLKIMRVHGSAGNYLHDEIGHNSRLDNLQAGVLLVKLKFLDAWIAKRRESAALYSSLLSGMDLVTPYVPEYNTHTYHLYCIATPRRKALLEYLNKNEIQARAYYSVPLHLQRCYEGLGYKRGDLPVSEWAGENTLALPIYPELTKEMVEYVAERIRKFFKL